MPIKIHCRKCAGDVELEDEGNACSHGRKGFCYDCHEIETSKKHEKEAKEELLKESIDPSNRMKLFNIPPKYLNSSFENYEGNEKLVRELKEYKAGGVVLYGNTGCGKTHLAVAIVRNLLLINLKEIINKEWEINRHYTASNKYFKPVPDLLLEIRSSFNDNSSSTEESIIEKYSTKPFLVLDDLGSEKTSEFSITTLYIIIDRRDRELLPTIITTNLTPKEIEEKLGARIASRLSGMKNYKINMPDFRKRR